MKYNQFLLLLLLVICSCSQNKTMDKLTQTDSLLDRLETDSVKKMLCDIDTLNTSQESKVYYKLLYSQYQYIVDDNFRDTTLLNDCIRFYEKKNDKEKLARSYYYKGECCFRNKDIQKALFYEKYAEYILKKGDLTNKRNLILYQKICEGLAFINIQFGEYRLALHYAKLALHSLKKLDDKRYQAYELGMMSACYNQLKQLDSTAICLSECVSLLPHTDVNCRGYIFSILTDYYLDKDKRIAKQYLDSSFCYTKDALTYLGSGNYYYAINNKKKAETEWKSGLVYADQHFITAQIYRKLAEMHKENGDMAGYSYNIEKEVKEKSKIYEINNGVKVGEIQLGANNSFFIKRLLNNVECIIYTIIAAFLCIAIIAYIKFRLYKKGIKRKHNKSMSEKTEELQTTTTELKLAKAQIKSLKKESAKKSDRIERLNNDIMVASQSSAANAQCGKELYHHIKNGGTTVTWTKQDYELCMAYCKIEFAETMAEIERCYGNIAPRKQLIMLLQHLNYDYAAIGRVLGINSDSVRKNIARITPLTK